MSVLNANLRTRVAYDPKIKQHRELMAEFVQTGSWAKSPIVFYASEETQSDIGTMTRQTVAYYASKEFAKIG